MGRRKLTRHLSGHFPTHGSDAEGWRRGLFSGYQRVYVCNMLRQLNNRVVAAVFTEIIQQFFVPDLSGTQHKWLIIITATTLIFSLA